MIVNDELGSHCYHDPIVVTIPFYHDSIVVDPVVVIISMVLLQRK
jgi:hypothetical protein